MMFFIYVGRCHDRTNGKACASVSGDIRLPNERRLRAASQPHSLQGPHLLTPTTIFLLGSCFSTASLQQKTKEGFSDGDSTRDQRQADDGHPWNICVDRTFVTYPPTPFFFVAGHPNVFSSYAFLSLWTRIAALSSIARSPC